MREAERQQDRVSHAWGQIAPVGAGQEYAGHHAGADDADGDDGDAGDGDVPGVLDA